MTSSSFPLSLNGQAVTSPAGATLHMLLQQRGYDAGQAAFACAVNGRFVARAQWPHCVLQAGDRIDVVAPVTGG